MHPKERAEIIFFKSCSVAEPMVAQMGQHKCKSHNRSKFYHLQNNKYEEKEYYGKLLISDNYTGTLISYLATCHLHVKHTFLSC